MKNNDSTLLGQKFNALTIIGFELNKKSHKWYWICECGCGNIVTVSPHNVKSNRTKTCGCLQEAMRPYLRFEHGEEKTHLYSVWRSMRNRCYLPSVARYKYYGGRGITVCEEWKDDYKAFAKWAKENEYENGLSIERISVDDNYCPENCKWIEKNLQSKNRQNTIWVTLNERKMCLADACREVGLPYQKVYSRLRRGWSMYDALFTPLVAG